MRILKYSVVSAATTILYLACVLLLIYFFSYLSVDSLLIDIYYKSILGIILIMIFLNNRENLNTKLNLKTIILCLIIALALETFEILINRTVVYKLLNISINNYYVPKQLNTEIKTFLSIVLLAPLIEEIFFRGIILKKMLLKTGLVWYSIFFSSIVFSLIHLSIENFNRSIPTMMNAFIFGIVSGVLIFKTKNIAYSIILHIAGNLIWFLLRFANI